MTAADPLASVSQHRPLALADILDRAVALYRGHFLNLAAIPLVTSGIYLVVSQIVVIATGPIDPSSMTVEDLETARVFAGQGTELWTLPLAAFLNLWAHSALLHAASRGYMGLGASWRASLTAGLDRIPYLAVTSVALTAAMMVAMVFLVLPMMALVLGPWAGALVLVLCLPAVALAFLWVLWLWLHGPAVVIEGRGARDALERSRSLMRRRVGPGMAGRNDLRLSALVLVLPTIAMALALLVMLPAMGISVLAGLADWLDLTDPTTLTTVFQGPLVTAQLVANALYQPFAVAVIVIFYYDLRYRTEGLDLELRGLELAFAARDGTARA